MESVDGWKREVEVEVEAHRRWPSVALDVAEGALDLPAVEEMPPVTVESIASAC